MEDEELRWDAVTFESLANTNATTSSATLAKKQLVESQYGGLPEALTMKTRMYQH